MNENEKTFDSPVYVKDRGFIIEEIQSVNEAIEYMDDWPEDRRNVMFNTARRALHSCHDGRLPTDAARKAFDSWAKSAGVLEEVSIPPAWMTARKVGPDGRPV